MRRIGLVTALACLVLSPAIATAHLSGADSVTQRKSLWGSSTQYTEARGHARTVWNALNNVNIRFTNPGETQDVHWYDVNRSDVSWAGWYDNRTGVDHILMNKYYLGDPGSDGFNADIERAVAAHEVGHSLGLSHNADTSQLMNDCPGCADGTLVDEPQSHDRSDYYALWP